MKELSNNTYRGYKDLDKARETARKNQKRYREKGVLKKLNFDLRVGTDDELIELFSNAESKIGLLREMHEVYKKSTG